MRKADPEVERLAELLRTFIRAAGLSMRELDEKLGLSPSYASRLLKGDLRLRHLLQVLQVLGVAPGAFFELAFPKAERQGADVRLVQEVRRAMGQAPPAPQAKRRRDSDLDRRIRNALRRILQEAGEPEPPEDEPDDEPENGQ